MDIALIIVGLVALGLGFAVFVLMKGLSTARVEMTRIEGELASTASDRDRLGSELQTVRAELEDLEAERDKQSETVRAMSVTNAQLTERLDAAAKLIEEFKANREQMVQQFEALGSQTLKSNQEALGKFITERLKDADSLSQAELDKRKQAIESMVKPIRETLDKTHQQITQLDERVKASSVSNESLKEETARLTKALSRPEIRGRYGEIQLRRVAELAGMTDYCDFNEQFSERDGDGNLLRPDMIVTLPNERVIVVDAKANINAYIEAVNAPNETEREMHLTRFSKHTSEQVKKLADKKYWALFERSPEFVVMFVPGDHFIDAALSRNPQLLDMAAQHGVILASPSTLIGLLRAVQVGWREQALSEQAAALFELGKELHDRAAKVYEHTGKLGDSIRQAMNRYNDLVGSIDVRMTPTLRKFEEAGAKSSKALLEPKTVEVEVRHLSAGKGELFEG